MVPTQSREGAAASASVPSGSKSMPPKPPRKRLKWGNHPWTIRKRKDCNRWELIVRDPVFGRFYGGLYASRKDALKAYKDNWTK